MVLVPAIPGNITLRLVGNIVLIKRSPLSGDFSFYKEAPGKYQGVIPKKRGYQYHNTSAAGLPWTEAEASCNTTGGK